MTYQFGGGYSWNAKEGLLLYNDEDDVDLTDHSDGIVDVIADATEATELLEVIVAQHDGLGRWESDVISSTRAFLAKHRVEE